MLTPAGPAPSCRLGFRLFLFASVLGTDVGLLELGGVDSLDYLLLVRLVGENLEPFGDRMLLADKRLVLGHDLAHGRFDAGEVLVAKCAPPGNSKS